MSVCNPLGYDRDGKFGLGKMDTFCKNQIQYVALVYVKDHNFPRVSFRNFDERFV